MPCFPFWPTVNYTKNKSSVLLDSEADIELQRIMKITEAAFFFCIGQWLHLCKVIYYNMIR